MTNINIVAGFGGILTNQGQKIMLRLCYDWFLPYIHVSDFHRLYKKVMVGWLSGKLNKVFRKPVDSRQAKAKEMYAFKVRKHQFNK